MKPGRKNLITDVPGILVGNAQDKELLSGCTVLRSTTLLTGGISIVGGAPGTRDTELLGPDKTVSYIDGLVLSGGSAFGLDSASGVTKYFKEQKKGFKVGNHIIPIVPAAVLFDLSAGGNHNWTTNPYVALGYEAAMSASTTFSIGSFGAGTGATTVNLKGGLGSASLELSDGTIIGAVVAVNPVGSVVVGDSPHFWAAPFEMMEEFGGKGIASNFDVSKKQETKLDMKSATTIGIIATNATLTKAEVSRLAAAAQDGVARSIYPSHTAMDGDLIFGVSTNDISPRISITDTIELENTASICMARAIARAVFSAKSSSRDKLPVWRNKYEI